MGQAWNRNRQVPKEVGVNCQKVADPPPVKDQHVCSGCEGLSLSPGPRGPQGG